MAAIVKVIFNAELITQSALKVNTLWLRLPSGSRSRELTATAQVPPGALAPHRLARGRPTGFSMAYF